MAVCSSDAATLCAGRYATNWCEYTEELIAFFASSLQNFTSIGKVCLVGELRDVGTHPRHSKHCALEGTQPIGVNTLKN